MAEEPWNRVNLPFPSAVSTVRIHFSATTATNVQTLMTENEKVLKLIHSEILQTEIRLLYELLYILNNSYKGNKTFKGLKQVEQCVNRLKNMKLDVALRELADLCPNRTQRQLSIKGGECVVPSQPMLEWICLKVLGAAQLLSCTLNRCSKAFILSKQQMKWEEFVILNVVITSMLSRLWVIFRGMLVCLSSLYQQLLELIKDVAHAQPMPFLIDFSLPVSIVQFLSPSDALLLTKHLAHTKDRQGKKQTVKTSPVKAMNQGKKKNKEDLGIAVKRDIGVDADIKPFFKLSRTFKKGKSFPEQMCKADGKQKFRKEVREAASFTHMATHLEEMILWCKSQRMNKEKQLLTFLRLKCQKLKCLEAAGYNVQRKLQKFKKEACWALSSKGSAQKTLHYFTTNVHRRTRFQTLRRQFMSSLGRTGGQRKRRMGRQKGEELSGISRDDQRSWAHQPTDSDSQDDIDEIFASIDL